MKPPEPEQRENIYSYFHSSVKRWPDRPALHVRDREYSYRQLEQITERIVPYLRHCPEEFIGLFTQRSIVSFAGLLAILKAGRGYVPLNPKFPLDRNRTIVETAGLSLIIADDHNPDGLNRLLNDFPRPLTILFPETDPAFADRIEAQDRHQLLFAGFSVSGPSVPYAPEPATREGKPENVQNSGEREQSVEPGEIGNPQNIRKPGRYAYLLFTSGSTGNPKGVPVSHSNVRHYIDVIHSLYDFRETDRISHSFDLTFDPSVHDLFATWSSGASLYVVPERERFLPAGFIRRHRLTVWYSVPSIPRLMHLYQTLKENQFPDLRYSLFSGEALHEAVTELWHKAAPNSVIDNLYGPTENTINITMYRWDPVRDPDVRAHNGIVSIGSLFPGHRHRILPVGGTNGHSEHSPPATSAAEATDNGKTKIRQPERGELIITGPQVVDSYYRNEEATRNGFLTFQEEPGTQWYRTGDLVCEDGKGGFFYLGRKDSQIKIRGNRVELGEIRHTIESLTGPQTSVLLPWPYRGDYTREIRLFLLESVKPSDEEILQYSKKWLPEYMIPRRIHRIPSFPLNDNGKIDNRQLANLIENVSEQTDEEPSR